MNIYISEIYLGEETWLVMDWTPPPFKEHYAVAMTSVLILRPHAVSLDNTTWVFSKKGCSLYYKQSTAQQPAQYYAVYGRHCKTRLR